MNIQKLKSLIKEKLNGEVICFLPEIIIIRLSIVNLNTDKTEYYITSSILKELIEIINPSYYYFNVVENPSLNSRSYLDINFYL